MDKTKKFIGDIFGMNIQYVKHINTAVIDAVNAVGGVTVDVVVIRRESLIQAWTGCVPSEG